MDESFHTYVPDAQRARDFELAQAAGIAFPKVAPPSLVSHTFELRAHGARLTPAQDPRLLARAAEIAAIKKPEVANATWSAGGSWYLEGDMYTKSVAGFGSHGGVVMWAYDTSWKQALVAYNHSDWSGMGFACYSVSGWRTNPSLNVEGNMSISVVSGGCSTNYNWGAPFAGSNQHNSNDDAAYELWQAKEATPYTSQGSMSNFQWQATNKHYGCTGGNMRWTAPGNCP